MLMFGNPKLGPPLMLTQQSMGLDLPLRVVSFEDADGKVHVVYQHLPRLQTRMASLQTGLHYKKLRVPWTN